MATHKVTINGKDFYGTYEEVKAVREMAIRNGYGTSGVKPA